MAFVRTAGVGVNSLQTGLRHVCGLSSARSSKSAASTRSGALQMVIGDAGITLQRFIYEPNPGALTLEDKAIMCERVWKQVMGNAYVMESERAEVYVAESMYRAGQIPLREFVRAIACSETYRRRFYDCCTPMRSVELFLKHLLGRAPTSKAEMSKYIALIAEQGFVATVNSIIDSKEYELAFGDDYIPERRFKGTYPTIEEFNRMCSIYSAPGRTDKSLTAKARESGIENPNRVLSLDGAGTAARFFMTTMMQGTSSYVGIARGIPKRANVDFGEFVEPPTVVNEASDPKRRVEVVPGSYLYLSKSEEAEYKKQMADTTNAITLAQRELAEAKALREALNARIAMLEAV